MRFQRGLSRSRQFRDVQETASAMPGMHVEAAVLGRPTGGWAITEADLGHVRLLRGETAAAICISGVVDENVVSFALPLGPTTAWTLDGRAGGPDHLTVLAPGAVYTLHTTKAIRWVAVRVEESFFFERYRALFGHRVCLPPAQLLLCTRAQARRLRRVHAVVLGRFERHAQSQDSDFHKRMEAWIVDELAHVVARCHERWAARAIPRRLRWLLRARPETALDIPALCSELGTSERTLRRTFQRYFGLSPARYLRVQRLHRAREILKQGESPVTVTRVAIALGFSDQGRFAADYGHLFGELPSETLRRGRGRTRR